MFAAARRRRWIAAVLGMLMLQLSLLGGGMACATGDVARVAPVEPGAPTSHAAHTSHGAAHGPAAAPNAPDGPNVPASDAPAPHHGAPASHCAAGSACAVIVADAVPTLVASVTPRRDAIDRAGEREPRFVRPAPEPPPPRG